MCESFSVVFRARAAVIDFCATARGLALDGIHTLAAAPEFRAQADTSAPGSSNSSLR